MFRRKQFVEIVADNLNKLAEKLCATVPELSGVTLVPLWRLDNDALPAGLVYFAEDQRESPAAAFDMIEQTRRALAHQVEASQRQLVVLAEYTQTMVNRLHATEEILEKRQAALETIEKAITQTQGLEEDT